MVVRRRSKTRCASYTTGNFLGGRICCIQSPYPSIVLSCCCIRRGLEFKHIDPNLFAFCKKVSEEMRVSL
jgi:hypothetical protein